MKKNRPNHVPVMPTDGVGVTVSENMCLKTLRSNPEHSPH